MILLPFGSRYQQTALNQLVAPSANASESGIEVHYERRMVPGKNKEADLSKEFGGAARI